MIGIGFFYVVLNGSEYEFLLQGEVLNVSVYGFFVDSSGK